MPKKQWKQTTNMVYKKVPVEDRFLSKVIIKADNECWIWNASLRKAGGGFKYGQFSFNGYPEWAHRVAYILFNGPIPEGAKVCHSCDNTLCVNPNHLFLGTQKDNIHDMMAKDRDAFTGERNHNSKMTKAKVLRARTLRKKGMSYASIGKILKVSISTIVDIIKNRTWSHV